MCDPLCTALLSDSICQLDHTQQTARYKDFVRQDDWWLGKNDNTVGLTYVFCRVNSYSCSLADDLPCRRSFRFPEYNWRSSHCWDQHSAYQNLNSRSCLESWMGVPLQLSASQGLGFCYLLQRSCCSGNLKDLLLRLRRDCLSRVYY